MIWAALDALGHRLRLPQAVMRPVCDLYELSVGVTVEQILTDYPGRCPWWLRRARRRALP